MSGAGGVSLLPAVEALISGHTQAAELWRATMATLFTSLLGDSGVAAERGQLVSTGHDILSI